MIACPARSYRGAEDDQYGADAWIVYLTEIYGEERIVVELWRSCAFIEIEHTNLSCSLPDWWVWQGMICCHALGHVSAHA